MNDFDEKDFDGNDLGRNDFDEKDFDVNDLGRNDFDVNDGCKDDYLVAPSDKSCAKYN